MRKIALSSLVILVITTLASTVWDIRPDSFFSSTIFTIAGIMFSVGIGLIVTFNPAGVKNRGYIRELRANIANIRNSFLIHFGLLSTYFIINQYVANKKFDLHFHFHFDFVFSFSIFFCLLMIYSSIYFIVNFIEIQKLNNDIFDKLTNE